MEITTTAKDKQCPRCEAVFCCSPVDCWCSKLPLVMPMSAEEDCLCPQCLQVAIAGKLVGEAMKQIL